MNDRLKYTLCVLALILLNILCSLGVSIYKNGPGNLMIVNPQFVFANKNFTGDARMLSYFLREGDGRDASSPLPGLDAMGRIAALRPVVWEDGLGGFVTKEVPAYLVEELSGGGVGFGGGATEAPTLFFSERLIPDIVAAVQYLYDQSLRKETKKKDL